MEKLSRDHLNQEVNINITSNKTIQHHLPLDMMHWEERCTIYITFLLKMQPFEPIIRKDQKNTNQEVFYKITA